MRRRNPASLTFIFWFAPKTRIILSRSGVSLHAFNSLRMATALTVLAQDLIRLGKRADPTIQDERAALAHGATQFKVSLPSYAKFSAKAIGRRRTS